MLLAQEIAEEINVPPGIQVETPTGWRDIKKVYRTHPLHVYIVNTEGGYSLRCSGHHQIFSKRASLPGNEFFCAAGHLNVGDEIATDSGFRKVTEVRFTSTEEVMYDITVDSEEGVFYSNGIVSHNSTTFVARQLIYAELIAKYKSLYIAPFPDQVRTYATRFDEMQSSFRFDVGKQNMYSKKLPNGSYINMLYALTTAEKIRGQTMDAVLIDECQNFNPDLWPEIRYTLTTSDYPSVIFAGTALSVDTMLEQKWSESSQGVWMIKSNNGKDWIDMSDPETLKKCCDCPDYPIDPFTNTRLNVTNGHFVHKNRAAFNQWDIGVHVPQLIIPDLVYNKTQWTKIYRNVHRDDWKKTMQECFGIAVDNGAREISIADLKRMCVIPEGEEGLRSKARSGYYRVIISGCDWGGSDYNPALKTKVSYTVHAILGLTPDNLVDILHIRRYAGMDYRDISNDIIKEHKSWNARFIASDFGVGMGYNMLIREGLPFNTHFVMGYTGPRTAALGEPKNAHMYNQLSLNRTESITSLFDAIKREYPLIRARSWEDMETYLMDFMALYRTTNTKGDDFMYVRSATKADDTVHAINFAYSMIKLYRGEPIIQDEALAKRMREVLYGLPQSSVLHSIHGAQDLVISG